MFKRLLCCSGETARERNCNRAGIAYRWLAEFAQKHCGTRGHGQDDGLNPRKYVQWLLEEMPNAENPDDPAYLDSLMPWSESVPAEIRLKPRAAEEAAKMADDPIIDIDPSAFGDEEK